MDSEVEFKLSQQNGAAKEDDKELRFLEELRTLGVAKFDYATFEYHMNRPSRQVISVGGVRCLSYSELLRITDFSQESFLCDTKFGQLFRGSTESKTGLKEVTVKTYDCHSYPFARGYFPMTQIRSLSDEIKFLAKRNLPEVCGLVKLSAFCVESKLAVVYDLKFNRLLEDLLSEDTFDWDQRMRVAHQLACILAELHSELIAVGTIGACSVLVDVDYNITLFEFGCHVGVAAKDATIPVDFCYTRFIYEPLEARSASYSHYTKHAWSMKSDVFAYGILLLELISKSPYPKKYFNCLDLWPMDEISKGTSSLVHESLQEDTVGADKITQLGLSCAHPDPSKRPDMVDVVGLLNKINIRDSTKEDKLNEIIS